METICDDILVEISKHCSIIELLQLKQVNKKYNYILNDIFMIQKYMENNTYTNPTKKFFDYVIDKPHLAHIIIEE